MKIVRPFKLRQKVKIVDNDASHGYDMGTIVTIEEITRKPSYDERGEYHVSDAGHDWWYISHDDAVPTNITNNLYKYILQ